MREDSSVKLEERKVNVEKIVVKYDDGTEKELTKGIVIVDNKTDDEHELVFEFANMSGEEFSEVVYGIVDMGIRTGILSNLVDEEEDEE